MSGYGFGGPHFTDDHSLDPHPGWDADVDARVEQLLDDSDLLRKGEA